jgi:4-hydroxybenzoate polyprenyltransferase
MGVRAGKYREKTPREKIVAWLELLRIPNLFTVPGDPAAGWCLAGLLAGAPLSLSDSRLYAAMAISLLLYCAGLLQNDCFDLEEDRRERPERPLPSGRADPAFVLSAAFFLMGGALALAFTVHIPAGILAFFLASAITAYNRGLKRSSLFGPPAMGLCRGLSFMVGASVIGEGALSHPALWVTAVFPSVLISFVTRIAACETGDYRLGALRWGPGTVAASLFAWAFWGPLPAVGWPAMIASIPAMGAVFWQLKCAGPLIPGAPPPVVQQSIGCFLRGLLLIQAALMSLSGTQGVLLGAVAIAAWPVSRKTARYFYAS